MKKHKCTSICITVVAVLLLACGTALAAWNVSEYAVNLLSMSSYKNSIQENYVRPDHVDPGQKVVKEVNIKMKDCGFLCPDKNWKSVWEYQ